MTPFCLIDASSAQEAVSLLRTYRPDAKLIASGGDLLGLLKEGVAGPSLPLPKILINLATASDLSGITRERDGFKVGAMITLSDLQTDSRLPPMIAEAADHIASPQLRARTTLGGNLLQRPRCLYFRHPDIACFKKGGKKCPAQDGPSDADPGAVSRGKCRAALPSDLAPVLTALDATAKLIGPEGTRKVALASLYKNAASNPEREAVLEQDELLAAITLPYRPGLQAFVKIAPREANEFSQGAAAIVINTNRGRVTSARIVLGGIAAEPWLCTSAAELMIDRQLNEIEPAKLARNLMGRELGTDVHKPRAVAAGVAVERAMLRVLAQLKVIG